MKKYKYDFNLDTIFQDGDEYSIGGKDWITLGKGWSNKQVKSAVVSPKSLGKEIFFRREIKKLKLS